MNQIPLYPLKFKPILKHYLWGGGNLKQLFPEKINSLESVAESWEISDIGEDISVVVNGALAGRSLRELLQTRGGEILGAKVASQLKGSFPLLIKLIDAEDQLSIQVHPDDAYAKRNEGGKRGKTEMWYLLHTSKGAKLYCGFQSRVTREQFLKAQKRDQYEELLQAYTTQPGDVFFVPAGTIHSIGKGNILFEVQVASDVTYRLYDWGRVDKKTGKPRPTHLEKSNAVILFENPEAGKVSTKVLEKSKSLVKEELVHCAYFKVDKWTVAKSAEEKIDGKFRIYCMTQGKGELVSHASVVSFQAGDTFLIPAALETVQIKSNQTVEFLNVTV